MDKELDRYRSQLASNPDDADALARLEAALLRAGDWDGLVALTAERSRGRPEDEVRQAWVRLVEGLSAYSAELNDPAAVSQVALVTAHICEQRLGELEEAMVRFQQAFQLDKANYEALAQARRIYADSGRYDMVLQLLNLELAAAETLPAQADLYLKMAAVCLNQLDRRLDAVSCVRQALKLAPTHPGLAAFSDLLIEAQQSRRLRVEELVAEAQNARDPRQRVALLVEAASLLMEEAPDDPAVETMLREVLERDPRNEPARMLLEQHFEEGNRHEALVTWLEERAEATARKPDRLGLYQRLADVALRLLNDEERAIQYHRKVLELDPVEPNSLNFCVDVFSETERWADLVQVYEAALRVRHRAGEEGPMLVQIAMILWRKLEDLDGAESYFRRIKLNDPKNGLMLSFYVDFYRAKDDPKRLLATLAAQQQATNDDQRKVDIGLEMARVAELDAGNMQKAVDVWKALLKLQNDHPEGRAALRRLYTETGKWNALLEFLKEDLQIIPRERGDERLAVYRQVIEIYRDRMKLPRMVMTTWNELLEEDPSNSEALDALESSAEARSKWNELIEVLERRVAAAAAQGDTAERVRQLKRVADLWMEKFANAAKARESLEAVLEADPADGEALDRLVEIYRQRKDWRSLFQAYRQRLPTLTGEPRIALLAEMAAMAADKLDVPAEAVALWRQVLQADPERDEARDALEALLHQQRAWANLVTLYRERVVRTEGVYQLPWLRKLGQVLADHSSDPSGAAEVWQAVLALDPRDADAERFLRDLYLAQGNWDALEALYLERDQPAAFARILRAGVDEAPESATRVRLLERLAQLAEGPLADQTVAVAAWERLLHEAPDHLEAARRLSPYYARVGAWGDQVRCLEVQLAAGPADPVGLMVELAQVHEGRLGQPDVAWGWRSQALAAAPTRPDLLADAQRTAASIGRQADLADGLAAAVAGLTPQAAVPLRRVLAALYAEELGQPAAAVAEYEQIRQVVGDEPALLTALETLYQRLEDWDALHGIYEQRLLAARTAAESATILLAMGELHETVREDMGAARAAYLRIRELDPRHVEALRGLQRLARQAGDISALSDLLEAELAQAHDPRSTAGIRFQLGQLADEMGDREGALAQYRLALGAQADHPPTLSALEGLLDQPEGPQAAGILEGHLRRGEAWDGLRRALALQVEGTSDPARRTTLLREVAELEEHRLGDQAAAFGTWQRLLEQNRTDTEVRAELERLALDLNRFEELAEHYARFAVGGDFAADDPELALTFSRLLATVQEERLGRPAEARATLEALLVEQGDDVETLDALERLATRMEDWRGLVDLGERRLALVEEPAARREILFRIGDLWEEVLEAPDQAAGILRRILGEYPEDERAFRALDRILRKLGRWFELGSLLRGRLEALEGGARTGLALELASLLQDELAAPADAIELYGDVLNDDPTDEAAADALQMLIVERDGPEDRALRQRACEILEPVYAVREDWQSQVHLLQVQLGDEEDPAARAALGVRIAATYELQAHDPQAAFASYGAAFGEAWGDPEILASLERLAGELGAWSDLAWHLRRGLDDEAGALMDPTMRHGLLERVAVLYEHQVGDFGQAIDFNSRLLAEVPGDEGALTRLDHLYTQLGEGEALAVVLEERAQLAEPAASLPLLFRLGALLEDQLGSAPRATAVYQRIRAEAEPGDVRAHGALERLHEAAGDFIALVEVLVDHAEAVEDLGTKRTLLLRAAEALEVGLDRPGEAIEIYRQVRGLDETDREVLGHLERLLVRQDQPLDLLEVLETQRDLAGSAAQRADIELRIGQLFSGVLGEPARALEAYRAVLAVRPGDAAARTALTALLEEPEVRLDAARTLLALHEADQAWEPLRDVLRLTLDDLDEPADQVATLERIAEIEERRLGHAAAALDALAAAWRRDEASPRLEPGLLRLAEAAGQVRDLVALYVEQAELVMDRGEALRLEAARLAEVRLKDPQLAIEQLQAVLHLDSENAQALEGLERLLSSTGDVEGLAEVLARKVDQAPDAERRAVLVRLAELQEGLLDDGAGAVETWRRVLGDVEDDREALDQLERLLGAQGRWVEVAALLEHRLTVEPEAAQPTVELRLARVLEGELAEGERALELYARVLEAQPENRDVAAALAALFGQPDRCAALGLERSAVAAVLQPALRREGSAAQLVEVLEVIQESALDDLDLRVALVEEIATLREQALGQPAAAFEARGRLLRLAPQDQSNRNELARLAGATWKFDALASLLEDTAAEMLEPELKVELLLELARIEEAHRGQDGRAIAVYREVLSIDPESERAADALVELFGRNAAWDELVRLHLERAQGASSLDAQKDLYFKACQLLEEVVGDRERAIAVYRQVVELDPDDGRARGALQRFFRQDGRWAELADLLREEIEATARPEERAHLRLRLAEVLETRLEDPDGAITELEAVLEEELDDRAPRAAAVEALEQALMELDAVDGSEARRYRVAVILEPIYAEAAQWSDLVLVMEVRLAGEDDRWQRLEILAAIARTQEEKLGDSAAAFAAWARAFSESPGHEEARTSLGRLAERLGAWRALAEAWQTGAQVAEDPDTALELLSELGTLREVHLDDRIGAVAAWQQVLRYDDGHAPALDALERLMEALGDVEGLVAVLTRKAELADDADQRRGFRYRIGRLQEDVVQSPVAAIDAWRVVFEEDPADITAIQALVRLYEGTGQWQLLIEMLREQQDQAETDAGRKAALVRIAATQERSLGEVDDAIMSWRSVMELDARDPEALVALERLLTAEGRWGELIDLLDTERAALQESEPALAEGLALRIADVLAERLGQQAQVIEIYAEILERASHGLAGAESEQARISLEALLTDAEHRLPAARVLEAWYTRREAWSALARIFEIELLDLHDREDRIELLKRLGDLQRGTLGKGREAFDTYGRALAEDPTDADALAALEALTEDLGLHPEFADLLEARGSEVLDVSIALELHRRLARLVDLHLGVSTRAIAAWQAVLHDEPFDVEALVALERLYTQEENWSALIGVLRRRIEAGADNLADLQCKLGYLLEAVEGDVPAAIELYRTVLWDKADHPVALQAVERLAGDLAHRAAVAEVLEPLYREAEEWAKLALLTEMRIELTEEPRERGRLWLQSAELREERLSDPASAFEALLRAFSEQPTVEDVRERLLRVGEAQGAWARMAGAFEGALDRVADLDTLLEDHLRLAAWSRDHLNDSPRAVLHFRAALAIEPGHAGALNALEAMFREAQSWSELAEVVARRAEQAFDLEVRRARLMELGTLRADRLGDAEGAAAAWEAVLAQEEGDAEALAALEQLHEATGDWGALCALLARRAESTYEDAALVAIHERIGLLALEKLGDRSRAADAFERVLEIDPERRSVLDRLEVLYPEMGEWARLQEVLHKALAASEDDVARARLLVAQAENAEVHLGRPEVAMDAWRQALSLEPANERIIDRLAALYQKAERWYDLVEVWREHLDAARATASADRRLNLLVALAEVAEAHLRDADLAIECLNEVLASQPAHGGARLVLAGLYEQGGDWEQAAEALQRVAVDAAQPRERGTAWRRLGLLYRDRLDRSMAANEAFERALKESGDGEAVEALLQIALAEGADARAVELLTLRLATLEGAARLPALRSLAPIQGRLGDQAGRIATLEAARQLAPSELELTDALVEALTDAGRVSEAEPLLQGVIDELKAARRFRELFRFNFRLGCLAEARGDDAAALEAYTACFEFDATSPPTLMRLGRLYHRRQDWPNALRIFQTALLHQMKLEREERAELFFLLGEVRLALDEPRKAKDMFSRALSQVADHGPSKAALQKLEG